jgi:D-alanyl-lipoteichoic acid acyltransferase DltB (MBOAT superfamily)
VAARIVGGAVGAVLALELALHTFYAPSAVFYPSFSHGTRLLADALQPWDWALNAFAFLTATWLTSAAVFAVPRGVAALQRVAAPHDTPLGWTAASVSCRRYWANFHASLFDIFMRYIFLPLGGGNAALLATVAFSTFIHGFHAHWFVWGAGNAATLALERSLAKRCAWYAAPAAPVRAANQVAAVMLMAALALGGELPRRALGHIAAFGSVGALLNAVWLGR